MRIEFTVDFGYRLLYSRAHYHPTYCWDGAIGCTAGKIISVGRLMYSESIYGPVHSPVETPLAGRAWQFSTQREIIGIHVVAEGDETAEFSLKTVQGDFNFSARQIMHEGRIVFPVGSKYSYCTVIVTRKGYLWFRPAPLANETVIGPAAFTGAETVSWSRMEQAWIEPGAAAGFDAILPEFERGDDNAWLVHLQGMTAGTRAVAEAAALDSSQDPPLTSSAVASAYIPMELYGDGRLMASPRYFFRQHDAHVQLLHDVWVTIPMAELAPGPHHFRLVNRHPERPLLVNRISLRPKTRRHLALQAPAWALVGREALVTLDIHEPATVQFECDAQALKMIDAPKTVTPGRHDVRVMPRAPGQQVRIAGFAICNRARPPRRLSGRSMSFRPRRRR